MIHIMKNKLILYITIAVLLPVYLLAQSKYDAKAAFTPDFYPFVGNNIRTASGKPGPNYWQNRADYNIVCSLDTTKHMVSGKSEMIYTNNSPDDLKFLWLQMDQNIYQNDSRGTFTTKEGFGRWTNSAYTQGVVISSIAIEENGKKYIPKYTVSDTRMQVWLQNVLKANGSKMKLTIDYSFEIPQYGTDRMGRLSSKYGWIYEVAQWYPRACVYDDIQGWNVLPYLGQGEFYLEYGNINFSITAPSNMIVVGSGELLNPSECFIPSETKKYNDAKNSDNTVVVHSADDVKKNVHQSKASITWKFEIQNARDVAWAASKAFVLDGAKINLSGGKKSFALSAYPVESISKNGWNRSTEMVKGSIEYNSEKWYEYPYPAATNVAGNVAGMEYPGIVFCGYMSSGSGLWGVTDHEFGHTWFPMIVGSNERKYAWMDEGFNSFINNFSTVNFNKGEFKNQNFFGDPTSTGMVNYMFNDKMDIMYTNADVIQEYDLGEAAYSKPALMLHCLRDNVLGAARFDAAFREYISRWAYKHPTPWDFFHTMENVGGEDLGWFWRSWVFNNWKLDQSIKEVTYNQSSKNATISIQNLEQMPMPVTVLVKEQNGQQHTVELPVEIWQRGSEYSFNVSAISEVTEVALDPDKKLPDYNRMNNYWKKK
jgi:hypothetical protein